MNKETRSIVGKRALSAVLLQTHRTRMISRGFWTKRDPLILPTFAYLWVPVLFLLIVVAVVKRLKLFWKFHFF